jgi:hypothetical protein
VLSAFVDPHLGLSFEHVQDVIDGVTCRRAMLRLSPLLDHAKPGRAVPGRDVHLRDDTRPPFRLWLTIEIDDLGLISDTQMMRQSIISACPGDRPTSNMKAGRLHRT